MRRLLAGELLDTGDLAYEFNGWHLGLIAAGLDSEGAIRELLGSVDCRPLLVRRNQGVVWAWLGTREELSSTKVAELAPRAGSADACIAIGEPGRGLVGWRLTHRQARAALPIAQRRHEPFVKYADVALLSSMLRDDLLIASLHELYLAPLGQERDGGAVARQTLRAYIAVGRYVSAFEPGTGIPGEEKTLVESWSGIEWAIQPSPNPEGKKLPRLNGVSCTASNACIAVGQAKKELLGKEMVTLGLGYG